ncbi:MAG TPA: A24 family peptidase [Roseiflexaceae bacterium]|nr:A24 family peptidase [Roseiflexaceae bacterium]
MQFLSIALFGAAAAVLIAVAIIDIRERRIPNKIMVPALAVALAVALAQPDWGSRLAGGLVAGGLMLLPALIYGLERAGGGDIKLGLFIGLLLGWPGVVPALMIACTTALIFAVGGMLARRLSSRSVIAFGPFLALGGLLIGSLQFLL